MGETKGEKMKILVAVAIVLAQSFAFGEYEGDPAYYESAIESLVVQTQYQREAKQASPIHETLLKLYKLQELGSNATRAQVNKILAEQNPAQITQSDYKFFLKNEISGTELPPYTVVLTFDDGPHETRSLEIAAELQKHGLPATFFEVGEEIQKYPHVTQELKNRGFLLANHSLNHKNLTKLEDPLVHEQIHSVQDMLDNLLNTANYWTTNFNMFYAKIFTQGLSRNISHNEFFRSPYGARSRRVLDIIRSYDVATSCFGTQCSIDYLQHVVWLIDSLDWADKKPESIEKRVFAELAAYHNRGVILFHDVHAQTVEAVKLILPRLIKEGYKVVTMYDAMAAHSMPMPPAPQSPGIIQN
jgi:peptidoglycan/xylan/chitin deacetylase (PgdA/CDA1 family)